MKLRLSCILLFLTFSCPPLFAKIGRGNIVWHKETELVYFVINQLIDGTFTLQQIDVEQLFQFYADYNQTMVTIDFHKEFIANYRDPLTIDKLEIFTIKEFVQPADKLVEMAIVFPNPGQPDLRPVSKLPKRAVAPVPAKPAPEPIRVCVGCGTLLRGLFCFFRNNNDDDVSLEKSEPAAL